MWVPRYLQFLSIEYRWKRKEGAHLGVFADSTSFNLFQLSNTDYKKKLFYLKWQGDYVISTVNRSHPGRGANDHWPHWQFNSMGWFFSNEFTSCTCLIGVTSLRLTKQALHRYWNTRERRVFHKAQSSCTEQGVREVIAFHGYARQGLKHKNRKWPIWRWL